ncbi:hypothetical protein EMIT0180MI3_370012 [Priestia megaterium]
MPITNKILHLEQTIQDAERLQSFGKINVAEKLP